MADGTTSYLAVRGVESLSERRAGNLRASGAGEVGCVASSAFRADTDQAGEWYVWTRLSTMGWATMQRCENRELAQRLADDLNQRSLRVAV